MSEKYNSERPFKTKEDMNLALHSEESYYNAAAAERSPLAVSASASPASFAATASASPTSFVSTASASAPFLQTEQSYYTDKAHYSLRNEETASTETSTHYSYGGDSMRYDYINNVENQHQPMYKRNSTEDDTDDRDNEAELLLKKGRERDRERGGAFNASNRNVYAYSVLNSVGESMAAKLRGAKSTKYAASTWGRRSKWNSALHIVGNMVDRQAEAAINRAGPQETLGDKSGASARKYGYKAGKYAIKQEFVAGRGALRLGRYGYLLSKDVANGTISKPIAKKLFMGQTKTGLINSAKGMGKTLKRGVVSAIENFHGSDDIGMRALMLPKDIVMKTYRSWQTVKLTAKVAKKTFRVTKNAVQKISKAVAKIGKKIFSNPIVIKVVGIAALLAICLAIMSAIASAVAGIFSSFSMKSEDVELSDTYLYITELDTNMEEELLAEDFFVDEIHYYVDGREVSKDAVSIYTDADLLLAYLDSKYEEYTFSEVKAEIDDIHKQLHPVTETTRWVMTDEGITIQVRSVYLTSVKWEDFYEENKDTLLEPDQQQQYDALIQVGVYTFRQELFSPFVGVNWSASISSRWGWRIHPIQGTKKKHLGLDIAMGEGTPINACNDGTVETGFDAGGWGNYIKVKRDDGSYTLYGHMSGFATSNGQSVKAGDVIGYVGSTGGSTGPHLHLEYHDASGHSLNPLLFTECENP